MMNSNGDYLWDLGKKKKVKVYKRVGSLVW